jgi:acetyl-CoA decarbonylase/synthase complex subunit delta
LSKNKKKEDAFDGGFFSIFEDMKEIELDDVNFEIDRLYFKLPTQLVAPQLGKQIASIEKLPDVETYEFVPPINTYRGEVTEVVLGATKTEGGTRSRSIKVGGSKTPPFYSFEAEKPNPPVVVGDVFDMKISLPSPVRKHFDEVLEDPAEWARIYVDKFGVDMIDIELISTDPLINDTPISESAKVVENVLQAVDVPIIIGGSGSPEKDGALLSKMAEVAEGERVLLSSATPDLYEPIAVAAKKHDHAVLSWTSLDINQQKELNRNLLEFIPKEKIIIDPTSAALGYGIEYAFTIMERMRLSALWADQELQMPMAAATSNSWAAREAWRKDPELGPRILRGPLWETTSALTFLLAGVDMFISLHPAVIRTVKEVSEWLMDKEAKKDPLNWVTVEAD